MSKEFGVRNEQEDSLVKVFLNSDNDYIYINEAESSIYDRFVGFVRWIEERGEALSKQEKEIRQKYGENIITYDTEGNVEDINTDALCELSKIRTDSFRETIVKIDGIFGEGTTRKYFKKSYECSPDFVPDAESILDFMDAMVEALNAIFSGRKEKINLKYSKNRKGGKGNQHRSR